MSDISQFEIEAPDPKPGSDEAVAQGCVCPRMDNAYGKGIYALGKDWWIRVDCPVHKSALTTS